MNRQRCHLCDKEQSVYCGHDCMRSMSEECNNQHRESDDTKYHHVRHVNDMYSLDYKFKVNVKKISDIKVLHDELLVIADYNQLVTCDLTGHQQHTITLDATPYSLAVINNKSVAVTLNTTVVIVDVRLRQVIQRIDVRKQCRGIMHRDNKLFVSCDDRTIKVMSISGEVTHTMPVGVVTYDICGGDAGRIYYTEDFMLYCIDYAGKTLFTRPYTRGFTIDDEGHVLVICGESNDVLRISPDGKQSQVIITQIPPSVVSPYICYISLSKSVVISNNNDDVYVYKKV